MMDPRKIVAVMTLTLLAAACAQAPSEQALRYRVREDPPNLDPFRADDDNSLVYISPVFDGLVEYAPGSIDVRPAVAESWSVSPDGLTYRFKLRKGVRFHNGREVIADDVVYSIRRALTARAKSQKRTFLDAIQGASEFWNGKSPDLTGVSAPDPLTVVITLSYPYESFLTILAGEAGSILPKEIYDDPSERYLTHPVGCGPFRFESWDQHVSITLSRFADHWKGPAPQGGLQKIVFRMIESADTALEEYRAGGLDFTQEIPHRQQVMRELPDDFHNWSRLAILYVGFNLASGPFKESPLLRQAIVHAIDREFIVRVLQEGKDTLAAGVVPPHMLGYDPNRAAATYDPNLASRLLSEAGYPGGKGLPELIYVSNDTEGFRRIADRVRADLAGIGLKVIIKLSDFGAFLRSMTPEQLSARGAPAFFRMTWFADWPDPDSFLGGQFATGGPGNLGHYHNADFDRMMEQGRHELNPAKRAEIYRRAESLILDDAALVPIYWYGQDLLLKPQFTGLKRSPLGPFGIAWEEVIRRR